MSNKKVVVFDLDDTLIKELHFLQSAFRRIANDIGDSPDELYSIMMEKYSEGDNVFEWLVSKYESLSLANLLTSYRLHLPIELKLVPGAADVLTYCKNKGYIIGLITDGRSITQRNKLKAIELESFFDEIVISEEVGSTKPSLNNFEKFEVFSGSKYYIGDNVSKDFITPNQLGWTSICILDDGINVHRQNFDLEEEYLPQYRIKEIFDVIGILQ